jgi:NADH-quinone oxidoreductase subunit N
MPFNPPAVELAGIAPELALVTAALILLVVDALLPARFSRAYLPIASTVGFAVSIALSIRGWQTIGESGSELQLGGAVAFDGFAAFAKIALAVFGLLTIWLSRDLVSGEEMERVEFHALVLFAVAGMMIMADAADLILVFLALETFSIALYVLVAFRRRSLTSQESSMKYFLLGSFSSAFFLLGIALAYGAIGGTNLYGGAAAGGRPGIVEHLANTPGTTTGLLVLATGLLIVGLGFKVAAVPFHSWTPDAYQGAPSPVTGFMAAGSKLAGFAAMLRLLDATLFSLRWDWRPLVIGIAVVTMAVGSILAVVQEDLKRMLAYSSIAHAGFVMTGVIAASDDGVSASLFYLATYGITVLGAFAVVSIVAGRQEQRVNLSDYRGLFFESPLLAGALTLFLLSLAGVPFTSGFVGKLLVFGSAIEAGYSWVAVVGVLTSTIAAFFYLRVLVVMYMQEAPEDAIRARPAGWGHAVVALTALATLGLGLYWGPLIAAAERATFFFVAG